MQREFVSIDLDWNVGDAIDFLRKNKDDLPEDFYEIYLLNKSKKISGIVPLGRLMGSKRTTPLETIKNEITRTINVLTDQEEVAFQFNKYAMVSAPVINDNATKALELVLPLFAKPSITATIITKIVNTRYSAFKNDMAPSAILAPIFSIFAVPWSCLEIQVVFQKANNIARIPAPITRNSNENINFFSPIYF